MKKAPKPFIQNYLQVENTARMINNFSQIRVLLCAIRLYFIDHVVTANSVHLKGFQREKLPPPILITGTVYGEMPGEAPGVFPS